MRGWAILMMAAMAPALAVAEPSAKPHPRRTVIERHVKVRGEANPYDPVYTEYFERRRCFAWRTMPLQKDWSTRPRRGIRGSGCLR